ncbi:MAG: rRNA maturation RNase YbeY [Rectinemataceae bacterium]
MNRAAISWRDISEPEWLGRAASFAETVLDRRGAEGWELSILFCGDDFIRELNREYRGKDEATDVLSFELGEKVKEGEESVFLAGDIVISLPALDRNAADFSVERDEELKRLIVHGILHLSGMDHPDNDPEQPMLKEQESILASLAPERIS